MARPEVLTDWAPGPWEAPGRFRIIAGGTTLEKTMGNYMRWGWNYAGKVKLGAGETVLELEDLTGFNGRCDAIYLCNRYHTPTNQDKYLAEWRERLKRTAGIEPRTDPRSSAESHIRAILQ